MADLKERTLLGRSENKSWNRGRSTGRKQEPRNDPKQEQSGQVASTGVQGFQSYFKPASLVQVSEALKRAANVSWNHTGNTSIYGGAQDPVGS